MLFNKNFFPQLIEQGKATIENEFYQSNSPPYYFGKLRGNYNKLATQLLDPSDPDPINRKFGNNTLATSLKLEELIHQSIKAAKMSLGQEERFVNNLGAKLMTLLNLAKNHFMTNNVRRANMFNRIVLNFPIFCMFMCVSLFYVNMDIYNDAEAFNVPAYISYPLNLMLSAFLILTSSIIYRSLLYRQNPAIICCSLYSNYSHGMREHRESNAENIFSTFENRILNSQQHISDDHESDEESDSILQHRQ